MEQQLKLLGLTDNEIKLYMSLLEVGENTVGPIIKKLNMHRQVAYDALEGLEKKNMVITSIQNNRTYFKIANPQNIIDNIKHREEIAMRLMPEIIDKLAGQKKGQDIKIYQGEKAYRDLVAKNDELQPTDSTTYIISGGQGRFYELMKISGALEKSNKIREKKNIKTKILYSKDMKKILPEDPRANSERRFLDQKISPPISIQIWHDSINLISFGSDIFVIEIKNEDFCQAYLNYFNIFWEIAKK